MSTNTERIVLDPSAPDSLQKGAEKLNRSFDYYDQKIAALEEDATSNSTAIEAVESLMNTVVFPVQNNQESRIHELESWRLEQDEIVIGMKADISSAKRGIVDLEDDTTPLFPVRSGKDENGIFTVIDMNRLNGTLHTKSELINKNSDGQYYGRRVRRYAKDGTTLIREDYLTLFYDLDGDLVEEVNGE
ncbi:hypothetical protein [Brevibacillus sp. SIMBA_040]|uniref:hypothetical protein n=1 Tax=unclassified Brevibacillus TaxID=2684853 RepID=UPI00397C11A7